MRCYPWLMIALSTACMAEQVECPVLADTWIAMHKSAARNDPTDASRLNHGAARRLTVSGRNSFALLRFDTSTLKGMTVDRATLRVFRQPDSVPLRTVGLSTISGSGDWDESSVNFFHPAAGLDWAYPGSDLIDVTFAQGGSLYSYQPASDVGGGWWEIDVPPAIVHALATGDQFGLMLTDEKGQTQTLHSLASRESGSPPLLIVNGSRADRLPPGKARAVGRATERPGSITIEFGGAGEDVVRYDLRFSRERITPDRFGRATPVPRWSMDPLGPSTPPLANSNRLHDEVIAVVEGLEPGDAYYFAARATDEAGNVGEVSDLGRYLAHAVDYPALPELAAPARRRRREATFQDLRLWAFPAMLKVNPRTGDLLEANDFRDHRASNTVWDGHGVTIRGSRNEFVAFQLALEHAGPVSGVNVRVIQPPFANSRRPPVFEQTGFVHLYREWFVPDDRDANKWYPDPLLPLEGPLSIPSRDNRVPGQRVQAVFVDIFIPHDAAPGLHETELVVEWGEQRQRIPVTIEVLPLTLPDKLNFIVDLNCYGGVDTTGYDFERGTPEYRRLEHAHHRMAHLHRTNLDVLGYRQTGSTSPDHAPPLAGQGAATRVRGWEDWDALFKPLLDGGLFGDLPRAGVPVPAIYLPFFENWPAEIATGYKHHDPLKPQTMEEYQELITRHALNAGPIEEAFSRSYRERFSAVVGEFAKHIREGGWDKTRFFVYLNNKYYRKRPDSGGLGTSWWLLDEPNHRDDVRAISFFGQLMRQGLTDYPDSPIQLRTDISRVEWIRDMLAGQIDLNCISRRFFEKNRYLADDRHRFGREYWNYSSTNHPRDTNVSMRAWCWRVWLNGGDGLLPWNAARAAGAWEKTEPLTVFYSGSKFGKNEPFASLRLKAYRRGQQDIEYLVMLAQSRNWDRQAVVHAIGQAIDLRAEVQMQFEEDAGQIRFQGVNDADLEALRLRVAQAVAR